MFEKILPRLMMLSLVSFIGFVLFAVIATMKDVYDASLPQAYVDQSYLFNSYIGDGATGSAALEKLTTAHGGNLLQPSGSDWNLLPTTKDLKFVAKGKVVLLGAEGSVNESTCREIQAKFNSDTPAFQASNKSEIANAIYFNPLHSRGGCMLVRGAGASPYLILG